MTNGYKSPEEFEGGIAEMVAKAASKPYKSLAPLDERGSTTVRIKAPSSESEAELHQKFGFSAIIRLMFMRTNSIYGYIRDARIDDDLELTAVTGANALNDLLMGAECLNRKGRYQEEEVEALKWKKEMRNSHKDDEERVEKLLDKWSRANAFILYAKIEEELHGIDYCVPLYGEFKKRSAQRSKAHRKATQLSREGSRYFWARVNQSKILDEQSWDDALGYPSADVTDLKAELAGGGNVHELQPRMLWPWKVAYQHVTRTTADGNSYREMMMSMNAQELPKQPVMPYGMAPGYFGPQMGQFGPQDGDAKTKSRTSAAPCSGLAAATSSPKSLKRSPSAAGATGARDDLQAHSRGPGHHPGARRGRHSPRRPGRSHLGCRFLADQRQQ